MLNPHILIETAQTYELSSLQKWLSRCRHDRSDQGSTRYSDPLTGRDLESTQTIPNHALRSAIESWVERHGYRRSPSPPPRRRSEAATGDANADADTAPTPGPSHEPSDQAARPPDSHPLSSAGSTWASDQFQELLLQQAGSSAAALPGAAQAATRPPGGIYPPLAEGPGRVEQAQRVLAALRPDALRGAAAAAAAAYHAWVLRELMADSDARTAATKGRAIPLAVLLLGRPDLPAEAKACLLGALQRLAIADAGARAEALQCGAAPAAARLLGDASAELCGAAARALYFLGRVDAEAGAAVATALAQQAAAWGRPVAPLLAFARLWDVSAPGGGGPELAQASSYAAHMLAHNAAATPSRPEAARGGSLEVWSLAALDLRPTRLPELLAAAACDAGSPPSARYAAARALHLLGRVPANRPPSLAAVLGRLPAPGSTAAGGDEGACSHTLGVLWEACYDGGQHVEFVALKMLHDCPAVLPAVAIALRCADATLRLPALGLLACALCDSPHDRRCSRLTDGLRVHTAAEPGLVDSLVEALQPPDGKAAALAGLALANLAAARGWSGPGQAAPHASPSRVGSMAARLAARLQRAGIGDTPTGGLSSPHPRAAILACPAAVPSLLAVASAAAGPSGQPGAQGAAVLALCNLCAEGAGRDAVRGWARGERGRQLEAALLAALDAGDARARRLLHEVGAKPGPVQQLLACRPAPPPRREPAYPAP